MAALNHNFDLVAPREISKFNFPSTDSQESAIESFGKVYEDLKCFRNIYHDDGRKILLITDNFNTKRFKKDEDTDLDRNCIFSGKEGRVLQNIIGYSIGKMNHNVRLKEIVVFNWPFAKMKFLVKSKKTEDINNYNVAKAVFYQRLINFIAKYQPDTVVISGIEVWEYVISHLKNDSSTNFRMSLNRLLNVSVPKQGKKGFQLHLLKRKRQQAKHRFQIMGTVDCHRLCAWDGDGVSAKTYPNLIGYFSYGFTQALNGRNSYTLHIPEDVKFVQIDTMEKFNRFKRRLWQEKIASIDTETAGLGRAKNVLYTIQFCLDGRIGYVIPIDHPDTPFKKAEIKEIKEELARYFEYGKSLYHIYQNGKFDLAVLHACLNVRFYNHRVYDIQGGEYALDENIKLLQYWHVKKEPIKNVRPFALDFIAERYGCSIYRKIPFSKGNRGSIGSEGLTKRFIQYAAYDVIIPFLIHEIQIDRAKKLKYKKFLKFVCEQLSDTTIAIAQMEHTGALIDKKALAKLRAQDGPVNQLIKQTLENFKKSKAARKVNKFLRKKEGVPEGNGIFGDSTWLFDISIQKHQQLLFFNALKLKPVGNKKDGTGQVNKKFQKTYAEVKEVGWFSELQKIRTLKNTFNDPIYEKLKKDIDCKSDGRIRSSYDYLYVSTGRLSCLDGNTPIYVLDKRGIVRIKDIKVGDWVWAFNKELKPVPVQVSWSGKTKFSKTVTVTYQSDRNGISTGTFKTLTCTPDHRIRLRNGKYVRADNLKSGDRVLALERRYINGYRSLFYTGMDKNNSRVLEHRVALGLNEKDGFIAHHKNEIKDDNIPSNLQKMTQSIHFSKYHGWTKAKKLKLSKTLKGLYKNGKIKNASKGKTGKLAYSYKELDKDWAIKTLSDNKWHPTIFRDKYGWDYATVIKKLRELEIDWKSKRRRYNGDDKFITKKMIREASRMNNYNEAAKFLKVNYYKAKELLEIDNNHEIIKVEFNKGKRWTYDITIPEHHNFIANGICVHNSRYPNLQNIPTRGDLAKHIKRIFIAKRGCMIVKNDYSAHEVRDWANEAHDSGLVNSFNVGMKLRQELRVLAYKYEENIEEWSKIKKESKWSDLDPKTKKPIYNYDSKQNILKKIDNRTTRLIGNAVLELEAKGDLHKLNCERFFKIPAIEVSDDSNERYEIKAVVFGVIYGKTAAGLSKPKSEGGLGRDEEYCQELIDSLFKEFIEGGDWIHAQHKFGRENLYVESPLGMQKHLWVHLHNRPAFQNAMDRRGPNGIIQGVASCIGISSIRLTQKLMWHWFVKHGAKFDWRTITNYVHDSVESEVKIHQTPLYLYMVEHASTTLIHKRYEELFGYNLDVGLEMEFQLGASLDRVKKWDFSHKAFFDRITEEMEFQNKELGYENNIPKILKSTRHNWNIIRSWRLKELEESVKSKKPSKIMLINEDNARKLELIL